LDTNPVEADPGKIVVGLQLYRKGDRLAIKIVQAGFKNGIVDQDNHTTKSNDDTAAAVAELINKARVERLVWEHRGMKSSVQKEVLRTQQVYIDLSSAEAPSREIMTGAKLYLRGNWICIAIQAAKLNSGLTAVQESTRHWIDAPGPSGKANENTDFYTIRGTAKLINMHPVIPRPLAPLRGAKFLRHETGDDHRMNLSVKTGLCEIEHIWEKYSLSTLTLSGGALLLADGYKGKVKVRDSQGLCVHEIGMSHDGEFAFDLVPQNGDKIRFTYQGNYGYEQSLGLDHQGGFSNSKGPASEFEWFPTENGSVVLKGNNGKFLGRRGTAREGVFVADQETVATAERFQIGEALG
jgi:hypothetical protein